MWWIVLAIVGAVSTSLTTIFTKLGVKDVNSNFATLIKTAVAILFSLILCLSTNAFASVKDFTLENYLFLGLSGICTGLSWLCYFRALKLGDINKVAPVDKSSFILSSILFLIFFFNDTTKNGDTGTIIALVGSMALMLAGTLLMIDKKKEDPEHKIDKKWLIYAILSAVFAALVSFFVKLGLKNIDSNVGTLFRTVVVFVFALVIVLVKKDYKDVKKITAKSWIFLILVGVFTGIAWLSEYYSLSIEGVNPIAVTSISKSSILITMIFSGLILKEKFSWKSILGLILILGGIALVVIFSL